tara:strand:- start:224 stop:415 length:192 start_codon:yes stop_codon:yes gene_type:complete
MPLAALFIGGVLPALLCSLIRKRAGYMKYNLGLKNKIQPEIEALSLKHQAGASSIKHLTKTMG